MKLVVICEYNIDTKFVYQHPATNEITTSEYDPLKKSEHDFTRIF